MRSSDNLQAQAIGLIFAFPAVATAAVALRIYSRTLTRTFAADDWVIFAAIIWRINRSAGPILGGDFHVIQRYDQHSEDIFISPDQYQLMTLTVLPVIKYMYIGYNVWDIPDDYPIVLGDKYAYATELIYNPILALVKTSILLFLLRLTGQKKAVRRAIWALIIINGVAAVITFLITVFHCVPIAANWDPANHPNAKCLNFANFVTGTASVSIFTDALVLMMPTWIVYNLQMQRNQKLMLIGILSFGLLTVAAGIIRVILLDNYDRNIPTNYTHSVLFCMSTIEVGFSFVAACAPSFKPLIARVIPKLFGDSSRRYRNGSASARGRLGYNLEDMSNFTRRGRDQNVTLVEAGDGELGFGPAKKEPKNLITMTTQMEVTWDQANREEQHTSSTESLVHAK
ncbi:hypothetical protein ASPZODRAFT_145902 [Penicilliopsis zonata CBS 506.65]|uniref:Rhodopsin domain-containing protein n=1 Tax=Penicilliopsis zonata CBS 506.65 TaxID=1073090 RepID=A0A1L9S8R8_9EURO|nr:hypothetical protein ASPZODRAFT_145902 [Penicilliopsis zonata CBS 506.65]OJJ43547.1 hypothetical protein ASPZODRAFT_145902 [Penicilliopsis zonata CBS 506.65]